MTRVITVTSGKGGVGKTNISVNLAIKLAEQGHRICLFDADLGLANMNIILGLYPDYTLEHVISGEKNMGEIVVKNSSGVDIIPGSSGIQQMADLKGPPLKHLIKSLSRLENHDYLILDTSAGISKNVIPFCLSSPEVILVITTEPTSLTDGYAMIKVLARNGFKGSILVVVNRTPGEKIGRKVFLKFKETVQRFLGVDLEYLGPVVEDASVVESVGEQTPFVSLYPKSHASACIHGLAVALSGKKPKGKSNLGHFWGECTNLMQSNLPMVAPAPPPKAPKPPKKIPPSVHGIPPGTPDLSEIVLKFDNLVTKVVEPLNALVENTAAISKKLEELKKAVEKSREPAPDSRDREPKEPDIPVIPLDFDQFVKNRQFNKRDMNRNDARPQRKPA